MSGIYGIFHKDDAPITAQSLAPLAAAMAVWGPDGHGQWIAGAVGLGHSMLHTTPESIAEQLPIAHPHWRDLVITADAWLDNRAELFALLAVPPSAQSTMPDSTLILLAYEKWGATCVEKLLGDFAFVIWDGRQRQLFCARDLFGNKPLLYYENNQHFIFASDIKGVLAHPSVPKQLYEPLLAAYLQQQTYAAQKRYTFWDGIVKVPPAHTLTVTAERTQLACYWSPAEAAEVRFATDEAYAEALRDLLRQAVTCRLRTPFAVGSHLSGGLDSSTVTALASQSLRQRDKALTTFSWSPPIRPDEQAVTDERHMVAAVCTQEGLTCHYLTTGVNEALAVLQRDVTTEPTEMIWREAQVQQQAQAANLRVLLSGWGGDEVVSIDASDYLAELVMQGNWRQLYRQIEQRVHNSGEPVSLLRQAKRWGFQLYRFAGYPLLPEALWRRLMGGKPDNRYPYCYIEPTFAHRQQAAVTALQSPPFRNQPQIHATQRLRLAYGHLTRRLEDWTTNGARHQLVYRYPLLDRRIVEFCLGIPAEQFSLHGRTRSLLRRAGQGILPTTMPWNPPKNDPAAVGIVQQTYRQLFPQWLDLVLAQPHPPRLAHYIQLTSLKEVRKKITQLKPSQMTGIQNALTCFSIQQLM